MREAHAEGRNNLKKNKNKHSCSYFYNVLQVYQRKIRVGKSETKRAKTQNYKRYISRVKH